jgi:pimeloyl-ACP methyl ester carboxylesterase
MPIFVLLGERDRISSPRRAADRARHLLPRAKVEDCDHAIPIDAPEATAKAIKEYAGP